MQKERYREAMRYYNSAIRTKPRYAKGWNAKGGLLLTLGEVADARKCFDKAVLLDPKYVDAWMNRVSVLLVTGSYSEALKCLDEVTRITPDNERVWLEKGGLLMHLKNYREAIECYDRALTINPESSARLRKEDALRKLKHKEVVTTKRVSKKICLLGDSAVGKTSLIRRYVLDIFDGKYLSTIGAKITKKTLTLKSPEPEPNVVLTLMIWDIAGQREDFRTVHETYYKGAEGALIVCHLTCESTLHHLVGWANSFFRITGKVPVIFLANKSDLKIQAGFDEDKLKKVASKFNSPYFFTSAKTGAGVEAFSTLANIVV